MPVDLTSKTLVVGIGNDEWKNATIIAGCPWPGYHDPAIEYTPDQLRKCAMSFQWKAESCTRIAEHLRTMADEGGATLT